MVTRGEPIMVRKTNDSSRMSHMLHRIFVNRNLELAQDFGLCVNYNEMTTIIPDKT